MAVRKFYSNKTKAGWKFDGEKFWSWGFDIYLASGKRKRESGFATKTLAENAVARIKISEKENKYDLETREFPLLSVVLDHRLLRIENRRERIRAERIFRVWLKLLPAFLRIDDLTASDIRKYINLRLPEVKAETVNREITVIASALHSAFLDFPTLESWNCPKIPRPKYQKSRRERIITDDEAGKKSRRERIITDDEAGRILNYLFSPKFETESGADERNRNRVGRVFHFALLTGARIGEIAALAWTQIDFSGDCVQIVGMKTRFKQARNVRYLELTETMREIFAAQKIHDDFPEFVFSKTGNSITDLYLHFEAACRSSGIKYGRGLRGGLVIHDARHTAITKMLQAGIDLSTVGAISGHSDAHLILHYAHATRESRKKAVEVLDIDFVRTIKKSAAS